MSLGAKFFQSNVIYTHYKVPIISRHELFIILSYWMANKPIKDVENKTGAVFVKNKVIQAMEFSGLDTTAGVEIVGKFRKSFLEGGEVYLSSMPTTLCVKMMAQAGISKITFCTNMEQVDGNERILHEISTRYGIRIIPYRMVNGEFEKIIRKCHDLKCTIMKIKSSKAKLIVWVMVLAILVSLGSCDSSRQVGAVIFKESTFDIVGIGLNGMMVNTEPHEGVFLKKKENKKKNFSMLEKEQIEMHAEQNAILNSNQSDLSNGCIIITTDSPCRDQCRKILLSQNIESIFLDLYKSGYGIGKKIFTADEFIAEKEKYVENFKEDLKNVRKFKNILSKGEFKGGWFYDVIDVNDVESEKVKLVLMKDIFLLRKMSIIRDKHEKKIEQMDENFILEMDQGKKFIKEYLTCMSKI